MKWPIALSFAVLLAGSGIGASTAQTAPKINAQKLVDEAMAKDPEVVILSMHVTPPQKTENVIIASSVRPQSPPTIIAITSPRTTGVDRTKVERR